MNLISNFTLHNERGEHLSIENLSKWSPSSGPWRPFGSTSCSWNVGDQLLKGSCINLTWSLLPEKDGFICFEKDWKPNNCLLLDAYGKERMRLTVPWQMTGATRAEAGLAPTSFSNVSEPYTNPATGEVGKFGVTAHLGDGIDSKFYFELDWVTGEFLWCRQIRD